MHGIMAILYGGFLAHFIPVLMTSASAPTGFVEHGVAPPIGGWVFVLMACGVWASGLRDFLATVGVTKSAAS